MLFIAPVVLKGILLWYWRGRKVLTINYLLSRQAMTTAAHNRYTMTKRNDIYIIEDIDGWLVTAFTSVGMAMNEWSYLEQGWYYEAVDGELIRDF